MRSETIVALATPRGQSALAVIRMSGPEAIAAADQALSGVQLAASESHRLHVGSVRSASGDVLDQVVAGIFRAPTSATGEDVVEITCHGGDVAATLVMERLVEAGARQAGPGEFTRRAFMNGKMDLAQAEAIADLIHARSERAHRVSVAHLYGAYSELIQSFREEMLDLVSLIELELDFTDEDVEFADRKRLGSLMERGLGLLGELEASYRYGRTLTDGIRVAIAGRPNAGKSTLLNALLGADRAIVSDVAGTTRDSIEAELLVDGHRIVWVDTAGVRSSSDAIEVAGVERARRSAQEADVVLYVVDASLGLTDAERSWLEAVDAAACVQVYNKSDLMPGDWSAPDGTLAVSAQQALAASAQQERGGLRQVLDAVLAAGGAQGATTDEHRTVTSARHAAHIRAARTALERAEVAFRGGISQDALAMDLREVLDELGMITGEITNEDVLGRIFSRFCIGK